MGRMGKWVFKMDVAIKNENEVGTHAYECESSLISKQQWVEWVNGYSRQNKIKLNRNSRVWMWIIVDKQTAMGRMGEWVFKTKQ